MDLTQAKELTKERLRFERKTLLDLQDIQWQRNLETNLSNDAVIAEKNRLRNVTKLADTCNTTQELRGLSCH